MICSCGMVRYVLLRKKWAQNVLKTAHINYLTDSVSQGSGHGWTPSSAKSPKPSVEGSPGSGLTCWGSILRSLRLSAESVSLWNDSYGLRTAPGGHPRGTTVPRGDPQVLETTLRSPRVPQFLEVTCRSWNLGFPSWLHILSTNRASP